MPFSLSSLFDVFAAQPDLARAARSSQATYLTAAELASLSQGDRLVIDERDGFVVSSSPGDPGHPVIAPLPETVFADPPMDRVFRDRRRVRRDPRDREGPWW